MKSGIYTITNLANGKIYVGASKNMQSRRNRHFSMLQSGTHFNEYLQKDYDSFGIENIRFEVIEECLPEYLFSMENYWCIMLDTHNPENGYNILITNPTKHGKHSERTKEKIRKSGLKYFEENPEAGAKHSQRLKEHYKNPDNRRANSDRIKKYYDENPGSKDKNSQSVKEYYKRPGATEKMVLSRSKYIYTIKDLDGNVYITRNVREFCREKNICHQYLYLTIKGKHAHYEKYRIVERKPV